MKKQKTLLSLQKIVLIIAMLTAGLSFNACNNDDPDPDPEISSVSYEGNTSEGFEVTVYGEHFTSDTSDITITVTIEGEEYTVTLTSACDTAVSFTLPADTGLGSTTIVLAIEGRSSSATETITLANDPFTVTGLDETEGYYDDKIKIEGTKLYKDDFKVTINDVNQEIVDDAGDGTWIRIILTERTFSGEVTVTRKSDSISVTLDDDFEYKEEYTIDEITLTGMDGKLINNMEIGSENFYFSGSSLLTTNSDFEVIDTARNIWGVKRILLRDNGDLLASWDTHIFKYKGNDEFDTVISNTTYQPNDLLENINDGYIYYTLTSGSVMRFNEYNSTPEELISINTCTKMAIDNTGNLFVISNDDLKVYLVDVKNKTKEEYLSFSSTITDDTNLRIAMHPVSHKVYLFSDQTSTFYVVDENKELVPITFAKNIDITTFDSPRDMVFDANNNLYLICKYKLYLVTIE